MAASLNGAHPRDMVELVRTAMRIFGFKSDAAMDRAIYVATSRAFVKRLRRSNAKRRFS